jgi:hypothetical protein
MREARDAASRVPQQSRPDIPRDAKGNCAKCGGPGTLKDGAFCEACPTGRDLSRIAKRKPKPNTALTGEEDELARWQAVKQ